MPSTKRRASAEAGLVPTGDSPKTRSGKRVREAAGSPAAESPTPIAVVESIALPDTLTYTISLPSHCIIILLDPISDHPLPSSALRIVAPVGQGLSTAYEATFVRAEDGGKGWTEVLTSPPVCVKLRIPREYSKHYAPLGRPPKDTLQIEYDKGSKIFREMSRIGSGAVDYMGFCRGDAVEIEVGVEQTKVFMAGGVPKVVGERIKPGMSVVITALHTSLDKALAKASKELFAVYLKEAWTTLLALQSIQCISTDLKCENLVVETIRNPSDWSKVTLGERVMLIDVEDTQELTGDVKTFTGGMGTSAYLSPTGFFITIQEAIEYARKVRVDEHGTPTTNSFHPRWTEAEIIHLHRVYKRASGDGWNLEASGFSLGLSFLEAIKKNTAQKDSKKPPRPFISPDLIEGVYEVIAGREDEPLGYGAKPTAVWANLNDFWSDFLRLFDSTWATELKGYEPFSPVLRGLIRYPMKDVVPRDFYKLMANPAEQHTEVMPLMEDLVKLYRSKAYQNQASKMLKTRPGYVASTPTRVSARNREMAPDAPLDAAGPSSIATPSDPDKPKASRAPKFKAKPVTPASHAPDMVKSNATPTPVSKPTPAAASRLAPKKEVHDSAGPLGLMPVKAMPAKGLEKMRSARSPSGAKMKEPGTGESSDSEREKDVSPPENDKPTTKTKFGPSDPRATTSKTIPSTTASKQGGTSKSGGSRSGGSRSGASKSALGREFMSGPLGGDESDEEVIPESAEGQVRSWMDGAKVTRWNNGGSSVDQPDNTKLYEVPYTLSRTDTNMVNKFIPLSQKGKGKQVHVCYLPDCSFEVGQKRKFVARSTLKMEAHIASDHFEDCDFVVKDVTAGGDLAISEKSWFLLMAAGGSVGM